MTVAHHTLIRRASPPSLLQNPVCGRQAIQVTIVTGDKQPVSPDGRGKTNRTTGGKRPAGLAGFGVQASDATVHRTAVEHQAAGNPHAAGFVKRHPAVARPRRPRGVTGLAGPRARCRLVASVSPA
ncbi:MAG: hypothetical protein CM1200mP2_49610 [Planctomycetaceae bacterium]|nr:MAG: hypothetical protein CM1200mP2_49610 [Planctomycetaceae bacterium]